MLLCQESFKFQNQMTWFPGPSLEEARNYGSGFIDEQDGSFKFFGGQDVGGAQHNTFAKLANDINAEFETSTETFSMGGVSMYALFSSCTSAAFHFNTLQALCNPRKCHSHLSTQWIL